MKPFLILCCLVLLTLIAVPAIAQRTASKTKVIQKYKPPKLITLLSAYKSFPIVNAAEAENIIAMTLRVVDEKKVVYSISSYRFLYRKNVVTEDEQTGKVSATTTMYSDRFTTTPLPEQWINKVRENLKKGEVLHFFDIVAKDLQGRVMYAPELLITVQ